MWNWECAILGPTVCVFLIRWMQAGLFLSHARIHGFGDRELTAFDDRTVEICREYTPHVFTHEWLGYGRQKQLALEKSGCPWVFSIDADEEVSPGLQEEIGALD